MAETIHGLTEQETVITLDTNVEFVIATTADAWTTERARRIAADTLEASLFDRAVQINASEADKDFIVSGSGVTNALKVTGSSSDVSVAKTVTLVATSSSTTGVIYKGTDRFIHDFTLAGTDGNNLFVGINAGNFTMTGSTGVQGSYNVGVGDDVLKALTTGKNNVAVGYQAMDAATTARDNVGVGQYSLTDLTTGSYNVGCGLESLFNLTTGEYNTSVGYQSLYTSTADSYNTACGVSALYTTDGGDYNTAFGMDTLKQATTADFNAAGGYRALTSITTGAGNTAWGTSAGYNSGVLLQTIADCTFIGMDANSSANAVSNSMALGHDAQVSKSNQVVIGDANVAETVLRPVVIMGECSVNSTGNQINFGYATNGAFTGYINYSGYLHGATQFRNLIIGDGKQSQIFKFVGDGGNLEVGTVVAGTSATRTINIAVGTAPGSSPASAAQIYVNDAGGADTACIHTRDETGAIIKLYQQAHIVDADGTLADITTKFNTLLSNLESNGTLANA